MSFKKMAAYKLIEKIDLSKLESGLSEKPYTPCGERDLRSSGWLEFEDGKMISHVGDYARIVFVDERKPIPVHIIKERYDEKTKNLDPKPKGADKDAIIADILFELAPKAFAKARYFDCFIDNENGYLLIANSTAKIYEVITTEIRAALGSLKLSLPIEEDQLSSLMTDWVRNPNNVIEGFECGTVCKAIDYSGDKKGVVRVSNLHLLEDDIHTTLSNRDVVELRLTYKGVLDFTLMTMPVEFSSIKWTASGLSDLKNSVSSDDGKCDDIELERAERQLMLETIHEMIMLIEGEAKK